MSTEPIVAGRPSTPPRHFPHAAVWLDHFHAVVVLLGAEHHRTVHVDTEREHQRWHRRSGQPGPGRLPADEAFYARVADVLEANGSPFLITGPGRAKHDFRRWLAHHRRPLADRVLGLEALDHPSEGELLAFARREFRRLDQLGVG